MAMRDEDFGTNFSLPETDGEFRSPPTPASEPRDWRSLCEQAQARADAAQARCEALRLSEIDARSRAGSLKAQLDKSRAKLTAALGEVKAVRRAGRDALLLQSEVARLQKLLSRAGVDSRKGSTIMSLRKEVFRLRDALQTLKAGKDTAVAALRREIGSLTRENARQGQSLERSRQRKDELTALRRKVAGLRLGLKRAARAAPPRTVGVRLRKALQRARKQKDTIKRLRGQVGALNRRNRRLRRDRAQIRELKATVGRLTFETKLQRGELAGYHDQMDLIGRQKDQIFHLHMAVRTSANKNEKLEAELAERPLLSATFRTVRARNRTIESLRKQLARQREATVRARNRTIESLQKQLARLRKANAAQGKKIKALRAHRVKLQARIARLRSSRAVLSKAVFGSRSEKQDTPPSKRKRGQQRGAAGHGRTRRPTLEEQEERQEPPEDARVCGGCGTPYVANGERSSSLIEISVKAHVRRIVRPRYRRGCDCLSSQLQAIAPPPARLFPRTPYGTSVWARILYERFACQRPLRRTASWMAGQGLAMSPGTVADSVPRFQALFAPLADAILAHQNESAVRHVDETGWRIQSLRKAGRSQRAWLWISVSADAVCFVADPSRSAKAGLRLLESVKGAVFLVCDRYVAYIKIARELEGKVILCWCWVHQRRDFIECAAGQKDLTQWCEQWVQRFASICRLNKARLKHYDPALQQQGPKFDAAQAPLKKAVEELFAQAEAELADLPAKARQGKALRSLVKHREGLSVFLEHPQVPLDNNAAERAFRGAVIGRRLSFGSDSRRGADHTATMYSVVGTLVLNGIDVLRWLEAWLAACAENGGNPPGDLSPWLPWSMSEERKHRFTAPG